VTAAHRPILAPLPDAGAEIRRALTLWMEPGQVYELRALRWGSRKRTNAGYFNDATALSKAALELSGKAEGVYVTLNPVTAALLARCANRHDEQYNGDSLTSDKDIAHRRRLLIDTDAIRPQGISATAEEHTAALSLASEIRTWLTAQGWPAPISADSGNGGHLQYRIELPVADSGLVERALKALALLFDTERVKVDTTNHNPARICKLYGTRACKGDNTPDRPHRWARILDAPAQLATVTPDQLTALAARLPVEPPAPPRPAYQGTPGAPLDVDAFIQRAGLSVRRSGPWQGGTKWLLQACPFDPGHTDKSAVLLQFPSGAVAFRCQHDSCAGNDWAALRARVEPVRLPGLRPAPTPVRPVSNGNGTHPPAADRPLVPTPDEPPPATLSTGTNSATPEHLTDLGNARRLVRCYGSDLRFVEAWGWVTWNGQRWEVADSGARRRAIDTISRMYEEAARIPNEDERRALVKWALQSESAGRLAAMLEIAKDFKGIEVKPDVFDQDPWILNCRNGTVDLRTGELRPHDRADYCTKLAPVDYDPLANCPTWDTFLDRIFANDSGMIEHVRRAVGYSLTGSTDEQVFFLLHGTGANGKSTLLTTLQRILGDYAQSTPAATLLVKKGDPGVNNDIARMTGARFVATVETEPGKHLATALIKQLTGQDPISARYLHREFFDFVPVLKLWFATNHKPVIRDNTNSIWRRVLLIPFLVKIADNEKDPTLPSKLLQEASGILAWAVSGCLMWQTNGLQVPQKVQGASAAYRADQDVFSMFLDECCLLERRFSAELKELYAVYIKWALANTERPMRKSEFKEALLEHGAWVRNGHANKVMCDGIGLRATEYSLADEPAPTSAG
jgi:P4 family phage/plasmid primase-like protien